MRHPADRPCPHTGEPPARVIAHVRARTVTTTISYRQMLLEFVAAFMRLVAQDKTARPLRLLDFGYGYGALLASRDLVAVGFEPSVERVQATAAAGRFPVLTGEAALAAAGPFDLFVCTEVLEHVPDPRAALRLFKANASPSVPSGRAPSTQLFCRRL